jgi:hypothetical protein
MVRENLVYQTVDFIGFRGMLVAGTWLEPPSLWLVDHANQEVAMTDKPKPTDASDKKDDHVLEPEEVISDAAETAFMEDVAEREDAKK